MGNIKQRGFLNFEELELLSNVVTDPSPIHLISHHILAGDNLFSNERYLLF